MTETAILAGGCFWCTEAIFQKLKGVSKVNPGYTGGKTDNPSYEEISSGETNHAEAVQIEFDSNIISYQKLLEIFFALHDPTTLNRQGADVGTQYRSAIFYNSEIQKETAEKLKSTIPNAVTEIVPFEKFYKAEGYHQNYYETHKDVPYCKIIIDPKIQKLYKDFKEVVK